MGYPRPPGTGRNTLGFTLGAVGGPRGTGAGISRQVILDFITRYDRGRLEQLATDLQKLNAQAIENAQKLANANTHQVQLQKLQQQASYAKNKLDAAGLAQLQRVNDAQNALNRTSVGQRNVRKQIRADIEAETVAFTRLTGLNRQQLQLVQNLGRIRGQAAPNAQAIAAAEQQVLSIEQQQNTVLVEQTSIIDKARSKLSGIQGLLLGAVGGIIGGAIVGAALFTPLQGALDAITGKLQDLVDPSRHAREAIKDLGAEINGLIDEETLTRLAAAQKYIDALQPKEARNVFSADILARVAQLNAFKDFTDILEKYRDVLSHLDAEEQKMLHDTALNLAVIDEAQGKLVKGALTAAQRLAQQNGELKPTIENVADLDYYLGKAKEYLDGLGVTTPVDKLADSLKEAADAAAELREELLGIAVSDIGTAAVDALGASLDSLIDSARSNTEATIDSIRASAEATINAIQSVADAQINGLQDRLSSLKLVPSARTQGLEKALSSLSDSGPSARTKALADQIERINRAQERFQYLQQLSDIAEQRHELILARRLSLQDHEINIEKYHGQDRITALDAEISRIQKRNQEQQKFNQLLDIEYQYQQGVKRTTGESITDFIQRRAQFYRGLINQTAQLNAQGSTDNLQKEKDRVEYEVKLRDLAEKRKQIINDRARQLFLDRLQEELRASQEADQKAVESRRRALQAQLTASKAADQAALDAKRKALQDQITAIRAEAKREIDQVNANRDAAIKSAEAARDATIKAAQDTYAKVIKSQEALNDDLKNLAQQQWVDQRVAALKGTDSLTEIERFAGRYGGSEYAYNLLLGQISGLGLPPDQAQALLAHAAQVRAGYLAALQRQYPVHPSGAAHGGVFGLDNAMNIGQNMRVGEEGPELGVILSNKVVEALHQNDKGRRPLFGGDMIIQSSGDPYRDRALWRREIKEVVRDELRH